MGGFPAWHVNVADPVPEVHDTVHCEPIASPFVQLVTVYPAPALGGAEHAEALGALHVGRESLVVKEPPVLGHVYVAIAPEAIPLMQLTVQTLLAEFELEHDTE